MKKYIGRIISYLSTLTLNNAVFIIAIFLLGFTTSFIYYVPFTTSDVKYRVIGFVHLPVNALFFAYCCAFIKDLFLSKWWRNLFFILPILLCSIFFCIEIFTLYYWKTTLNQSFVLVLLETNTNEVKEFLSTYLFSGSSLLLWCLYVVFIVLIALAFKFRYKKIHFRSNKIWILPVCILVGELLFCYYRSLHKDIMVHQRTMIPIQRCIYSLFSKDILEINNLSARLDSLHPVIVKNQSTIPTIVVIVGESLGRNRMSLYGYPVKTTPLLDSLYNNNELYRFSDVVCPRLLTRIVMTKLFTFFNNDSEKEWYQYNNLIDIMKLAGYKCYWISNQEAVGVFGNTAATLASRCQLQYFNSRRTSFDEIDGLYDGDLVPVVKSSLQKDSLVGKKFIVIHLMGSHEEIRNRYPHSFPSFSASDYKKETEQKDIFYDSSIRYNDFVVNEIIRNFKDEETLLFYFSDHGNVMDGKNGRSEEKLSKPVVEIPFLIWCSESFTQKYPLTISMIKNAEDRPFMTDDFIHTLLDLADIQTLESDKSKSIVDSLYNSQRERRIMGHLYEK